MGKGSRPRTVPFGRKAAKALDRYACVRGHHANAAEYVAVARQQGTAHRPPASASSCGVVPGEAVIAALHPHLFRHTYAHTISRRFRLRRRPHAAGQLAWTMPVGGAAVRTTSPT